MTSIIKQSNRTFAANAFLKSMDEVIVGNNRYYIGLSGKTTAWAPDPVIPDTPLDTIAENESFWDELFSIALVSDQNTKLVVPRINWESILYFNKFQKENTDAFNIPFYVLAGISDTDVYTCTGIPNSDTQQLYNVKIKSAGINYTVDDILEVDSGTYTTIASIKVLTVSAGAITSVQIEVSGDYTVPVYQDVILSTTGSGTGATFELGWVSTIVTTSKPEHTSGNNGGPGADGYTWTHQYDLNDYKDVMTLSWMPVIDDDDIQSLLGANRVLMRIYLPDVNGTAGKIPSEIYRKIGLLKNIKNDSGDVVTSLYGDTTDFNTVFAAQDEGIIMMLDHRPPVQRVENQSETIFIILEF